MAKGERVEDLTLSSHYNSDYVQFLLRKNLHDFTFIVTWETMLSYKAVQTLNRDGF